MEIKIHIKLNIVQYHNNIKFYLFYMPISQQKKNHKISHSGPNSYIFYLVDLYITNYISQIFSCILNIYLLKLNYYIYYLKIY